MDIRYKCRAGLAFAALVLIAFSVPATAQISSEVQSALRANCRSDAMSKCSGLRGQDALACLQKKVDSLSPACKAAVDQTLPKPHSEAAPPPPATAPAAPAQATVAPAAPPPPVHPKAVASKPPAPPAAPQVPTAAQQNAMRSACRSDFMSHCRGVSPGGKDALACLQHNAARLSSACKKVVSATMAAPAPAAMTASKPAAAATPTAAQQNAMRSACRSDFMSHCRGVSPGGKEALACLQHNAARLSSACKKVVSATMAAPAPAAAATAPAEAAGGPSPEQMNALKFTCRRDFNRHCKGVPPGPEAFACLQVNEARLSPNCRTSVAAIEAEMPEGGGAAMPAATMAPPPPKVGKPSVANAVVMLRACKLDLIRHCRGVKPGDGRELACLAAHEGSLSPRCRIARRVTEPLR
jgi:hypothetical protein